MSNNTETIDCVVIGAGVVGLAVGRALAQKGRDVVVLEATNAIGTGISSRNSEVIHAGIYYPTGSLKARVCVAGNRLMYEFCARHGVEHRRCGKLIVATEDDQLAAMEGLHILAKANGIDDLEYLGPDQLRTLEPALQAVGALLSPSSGIVDSHGLMLALQGDIEAAGGTVALNSPVLSGTVKNTMIRLDIGGTAAMALACRTVINCAGLGAQAVAAAIEAVPADTIPRRYLAKGTYFTLSGRAPFNHLIYPMPTNAGLGVHLTIDLGGQAKFGPDVEWIDEEDYDVDPARAESFYAIIRHYWPSLRDGALQPGYVGIRPKLQARGEAPADYIIQGSDIHGVQGLLNLYGIESPGLTSSLAIAEIVANMVA